MNLLQNSWHSKLIPWELDKMSIYIAYGGTRSLPKIGMLEVDAHLSEDHNWTNSVPNHPVETGYSVNDAIIRNPMTLTLESMVSIAPIYPDRASDKSLKRADNAYTKLVQLATKSTLLSVITGVKTYRNMAITDLSIPRSSDDGLSLKFTISLQEIRIARSESKVNPNADSSKTLDVGANDTPQEVFITPYEKIEDVNVAINTPLADASKVQSPNVTQERANAVNLYRIEEKQTK